MIKKHWGFLLGLIFVCAVAYAESIGKFDGVLLRPAALPSAGKDGELRVDSADSNKLKKYSETAGAWEEISGGGGGAGGVTYWSDFQGDDITKVKEDADYTTYAGTPDNAASNLSITSETSAPLSGDASYLLTKAAANASGESWILPMENPDDAASNSLDSLCVDGGATQHVTINYATSANYDNSVDERLLVYTYGNSSGLQACSSRSTTSGVYSNQLPIAPNGGQYLCDFTCGSADTAMDVVLAYSGTASNAVTIKADLITFGPDSVITAPIVSGINTVTPTGTWTANTTYTGHWNRVGSYMHYNVKVLVSGAPTATTLSVDLPSGFTMDTSKMLTSDTTIQLPDSSVTVYDSGSGWFVGLLRYSDSNTFDVYYESSVSSPTGVSQTTPMTFANNDFVEIKVKIPIAEWSSANAILSTTQADHSTVRVHASGSAGETLTADATDIDFESETIDTHNAWDGDQFTAPVAATYDIEGLLRVTVSGARSISAYVDTVTNKLLATNSYTGIINKFSGSIFLEKGEVLSFRTDLNSTQASGILHHNWITIESRPDFSTFSVMGVDEPYKINSSGEETYSITAGTAGDLTSQAVGAGDWMANGTAFFRSAGATTTGSVQCSIGTTSATIDGDTSNILTKNTASGSYNNLAIPPTRLTCTSACTIHLVCNAATSITNLQVTYRLEIERRK